MTSIEAPRVRSQEEKYISLIEAAEKALNYIENTESELGMTLGCGDSLRAALAFDKSGPIEALEEIYGLHLGDCPSSMDEADFARGHNYRVRRIARDALVKAGALTIEDRKRPAPPSQGA